VESIIHALGENHSVVGYVIVNPDGIPIKYHSKMSYGKAVLYAAMVADFYTRAKLSLAGLENVPGEMDLNHFRIRTKMGTELMVTGKSDYLLVVVQNCSGNPWVWDSEESEPQH
jgi:predicted regulator of Ras-like GTPase activity (Roadblock/LC7/MglB family)